MISFDGGIVPSILSHLRFSPLSLYFLALRLIAIDLLSTIHLTRRFSKETFSCADLDLLFSLPPPDFKITARSPLFSSSSPLGESVRSSSKRRPLRSLVLNRGKSTLIPLAFPRPAQIPIGVPLDLVESAAAPPWRRLRPSLAHNDESVFLSRARRSLPSFAPRPFVSPTPSITSLASPQSPSRLTAPTRVSPSAFNATHTLCSPSPSVDAVASPRLLPLRRA